MDIVKRESVQDEFFELGKKLHNLYRFMQTEKFSTLSKPHCELLERQYWIMADYHMVLFERLVDDMVN